MIQNFAKRTINSFIRGWDSTTITASSVFLLQTLLRLTNSFLLVLFLHFFLFLSLLFGFVTVPAFLFFSVREFLDAISCFLRSFQTLRQFLASVEFSSRQSAISPLLKITYWSFGHFFCELVDVSGIRTAAMSMLTIPAGCSATSFSQHTEHGNDCTGSVCVLWTVDLTLVSCEQSFPVVVKHVHQQRDISVTRNNS